MPDPVFVEAFNRYNIPAQIVSLGRFYGQSQVIETRSALRVREQGGASAYNARSVQQAQDDVQWTKWINDFNKGRQWILKRLIAMLDPMLSPGIAIATVPPHTPSQADWPTRVLARALAAQGQCRIDATACLERHTEIRRIVYGGPSVRDRHQETITVVQTDLIAGRSVLLLDDIVKSGESLRACRDLLTAAGAALVQPLALARIAP